MEKKPDSLCTGRRDNKIHITISRLAKSSYTEALLSEDGTWLVPHQYGFAWIWEPRHDGLVVSVSDSQAAGSGFASRPGHTKDHHKNATNCLPVWHACVRV